MRKIAGVKYERGRATERVDASDRLLKGANDIAVHTFVETEMAIADLANVKSAFAAVELSAPKA